MDQRWKNLLALAGWLLLTLLAGAFGSQFEPGAWYEDLQKPVWTPPSWLFGPIWTLLYVMIGSAAWMVWRRHGFRGAHLALGVYVVHLILNAAWSWIFFGLERPGLAFAEIVLLWVTIQAMILLFFRRSVTAGWLLIPYLTWVTFAMALNFAIWRMNM